MSLERIAGMLSRLCESAATLAKVAVRSRRPSPGVRRDASSEVVILGNGPGLRDAIDNHMEFLMVGNVWLSILLPTLPNSVC